MRLDRFLSNMGVCTRADAKRQARAGNITVGGAVVRDASMHIDPSADVVVYCGERVAYEEYTYRTECSARPTTATGRRSSTCFPKIYAAAGFFRADDSTRTRSDC